MHQQQTIDQTGSVDVEGGTALRTTEVVILGKPGAVAAVEKPPQKEFPSFRGPTNSEFAEASRVTLVFQTFENKFADH